MDTTAYAILRRRGVNVDCLPRDILEKEQE